jgi:AcrR family transcriptional regulator
MRDERRERILAAALSLFAANGLAATKISHIAARVRMSQGLLYHYFRSKEEIFTELVRTAIERMNEAARGLEALPLRPAEKIGVALTTLMEHLEKDTRFAEYFLLVAQAGVSDAVPAEARAVIEQERSVVYDVFTRILRAGQEEGSVVDLPAEELAVAFWVTIKGLALHKATGPASFRMPNPEIFLRLFLRSRPQN